MIDTKTHLENRFRFVDEEVFDFVYPESLEFLLMILDYFNVKTKDYMLTINPEFESSAVCFSQPKRLKLSYFQNSQKINIEELNVVILHELQHMLQFQTGDITFENNFLFYNGKLCTDIKNDNYHLLPWEYDANLAVFECPLFDRDLIKTSEFIYNIFKNYDFALELFETEAA